MEIIIYSQLYVVHISHMPFASHKRPNLVLNNTFKGQIIYETVKLDIDIF
jgi:hypothetical protein